MLSSNEVYYTDESAQGKNFFKNFSPPVPKLTARQEVSQSAGRKGTSLSTDQSYSFKSVPNNHPQTVAQLTAIATPQIEDGQRKPARASKVP